MDVNELTLRVVFHVQFRQFPNVARAFNLTREELDSRILGPWARGEPIQWSDRRWSPERAKLTIYEGPELRPRRSDSGGAGRTRRARAQM